MPHLLKLLAIALLGAAGPALAGEPPQRVVDEFYRWAMRPAPPGPMPAGMLGKELEQALEAQQAYERACARLVPPDIKPHMLDQSPFFRAPDRAKAFRSTAQEIRGLSSRVQVRFSYDDLHWTDTVLLARRDGRWVILDIKWQEGGSLTRRLVDFASIRCTR